MKRLLYLAALALTVLTSCKSDEAVVEPKHVENIEDVEDGAGTLQNTSESGAFVAGEYVKYNFKKDAAKLIFQMMFPAGYDQDALPAGKAKLPVYIHLHGSGNKGTDNTMQIDNNIARRLQSEQAQYPSIAIFPQTNNSWSSTHFNLLHDVITLFAGRGIVDMERIYLSGQSLGGIGTFSFLAAYPELFAAAMPVCGNGDPETVKNWAPHTSLWVFHGDKDPTVPVNGSRKIANELERLNYTLLRLKATPVADQVMTYDYIYSEYPGVEHNSWMQAFKEPDLLKWVFSKKVR